MKRIKPEDLPQKALEKKLENEKYFTRLRKRKPKQLDLRMQQLHKEEFEQMDCLSCANCCKTTSPMFTPKDIERIAKHLKMKVSKFIDTYLHEDEDGFMVLNETPCTFLASDNYCLIYDVRPKACREYPHTDRKKFIQLTKLTIKNTEVCPAVYHIVEELKKKHPF